MFITQMIRFMRLTTQVVNKLTANKSNVETDTTGFSTQGTGTTIERVTTEYYGGIASLKVVTLGSAIREGAKAGITCESGKTYTGSVYVKGVAGTTLEFRLTQTAGGTPYSTSFSCTGNWQRVYGTITTDRITTLEIRVTTFTVATARTFYIDNLMIEEGSQVSDWVIGTGI